MNVKLAFMRRCFNYAEFQELCPLDNESIIQGLVARHYASASDKRRQKAEENLRAIISATFELAASMGFAKMSMRDLHKASGLSLGGLYNYFESKEALALMITEALHLIAFDWLPSLTNTNMPAEEQIERLLRGHIYLSECLRPWFYFVFMESKNLPEANKACARDVELRFESLLQAHLGDDKLLASHMMALVQDWHVKNWKYKQTDIDAFADSVVALCKATYSR